jgi:uncharacterized protein YjbI with pentapeptide repeats
MAERAKSRVIGATVGPELDEQRLDPFGDDWVQPGFALEYVELGPDTSLAGAIAGSGTFSQMRINGSDLSGTKLRGVSLRDVVARNVNAANADWTAARMNRVVVERASLTGMQLRESEISETTFRECKFDYVNFRIAKLRNVTFDGCSLADADFGGAQLDNVRFADCRLSRVEFPGAELTRVDMRGSTLGVNDAFALRGAIISPVQLIDLAAGLAHAAGITVTDG